MAMDTDEVVVENPPSVGQEGNEKKEEEEEDEEDLIFGDNQGKKDGYSEFNEPSPRGVLEITSTCDTGNGIGGGLGDEKHLSVFSQVDNLREQLFDPNSVQWKSLFSSIKRKSARSISIIPLFGGVEMIARKSRKKLLPSKSEDCGDFLVPKPSWRNFSFQELSEATDNFSPDNLIGKGGHAEVYKGCIADGQTVAVKRITKDEKNDEDRVGDFLSELGIIAHINHPNASRLIGFSAESGLHLVLQYLPNGSLATALHGSQERLEWKARLKVAIGVAEGLQYLHSDCQRRIIHRDITASNILLTDDFEPQISDFGLAKWLPEKWVNHVVSPIEGTFGYMAPEYFMHGIMNEKTDVFAFGVLLLELITGRRAVDSSMQSLVMWAKPLLEKDDIKAIADPRLGDEYDVDEMKRVMTAAATCINHIPSKRPNMIKVTRRLKGEKEVVPRVASAVFPESQCMDDYNTTTTYLQDLNRHKQLVME